MWVCRKLTVSVSSRVMCMLACKSVWRVLHWGKIYLSKTEDLPNLLEHKAFSCSCVASINMLQKTLLPPTTRNKRPCIRLFRSCLVWKKKKANWPPEKSQCVISFYSNADTHVNPKPCRRSKCWIFSVPNSQLPPRLSAFLPHFPQWKANEWLPSAYVAENTRINMDTSQRNLWSRW